MEAHKTHPFFSLAIPLIILSVAVCDKVENLLSSGLPLSTNASCYAIGPVCNNCTSVKFCIPLPDGGYLNNNIFSCAEQDPKRPYCNQGVCSATPSEECVSSIQFRCTGSGYFPDPDDCQKFHFCFGNVSTTYRCSDNYVYSHQKKSCAFRRVNSDCAIINCKYATAFEYVVYPKDPNVYGLCIRGQPTVMLKCREGEQFDIKTSRCNFICKREGLFPQDGCRKYYECVDNGRNTYVFQERKCPEGTVFHSSEQSCVVGNCTGSNGTA